jgi:hypothetical protein
VNKDKNTKKIFDRNTIGHKFKFGDKALISNDFYTGKNPKLAPKFNGPGEIIDINDTNAKVKINNKIKVLNMNKFKLFLQEEHSEINTDLQDLNFQNFWSDMTLTRARATLINYKNAAQLELIKLNEEGGTDDMEMEIDSLCDGQYASCDSEAI